MNKFTARDLREKMLAVLKASTLEADFGVVIESGNLRFSQGSVSLKFEVGEVQADGTVLNQAREMFLMFCTSYGLEASDLGRKFLFRRNWYTITGLNTRARRMPIKAERVMDGRGFKFGVETVAEALEKKGAAV